MAVFKLTQSKSKPFDMPIPQNNSKQWQPKISLPFKKSDGWESKTPLNAGLKKPSSILKAFATVIMSNNNQIN